MPTLRRRHVLADSPSERANSGALACPRPRRAPLLRDRRVGLRRAQVAPEHAKQGLGGRDLAVLQEIEDRGERSRLGLRIDRLAKVFLAFKLLVVLLLDLGQFGLQDLPSVVSSHRHGTTQLRLSRRGHYRRDRRLSLFCGFHLRPKPGLWNREPIFASRFEPALYGDTQLGNRFFRCGTERRARLEVGGVGHPTAVLLRPCDRHRVMRLLHFFIKLHQASDRIRQSYPVVDALETALLHCRQAER